jgi:hypothetical protein
VKLMIAGIITLVGLYILTSIQEEWRPNERRDTTDGKVTQSALTSGRAAAAQSICCKLHHAIMDSVSKHIRSVENMLKSSSQMPLFT